MYLRKKMGAAIALLLVCAVLLVSVSYAWLSISTVPEITGIDTNIGANGSLEIALLTDSTYMDPSQIRASIGDSVVVEDPVVSNQKWGNVIDLSGSSYGLSQVSMLPARLNVKMDMDGQPTVGSNILIFPRYGIDGRSADFYQDSVSATFNGSEFAYSTDYHGFGVRAIGAVSDMTPQQAALANARSLVYSYTSAASNAASSVWTVNGAALLDIYIQYYYVECEVFDAAAVGTIRDTAVRTRNALSYIDAALRYGVVGYGASAIENEERFKQLQTSVLGDLEQPLIYTLADYSTVISEELIQWAAAINYDLQAIQSVITQCDALEGESFAWDQISRPLNELLNAEEVFFGEYRLTQLGEMTVIPEDNILTLTDAAGPMADVADFVGEYGTSYTYLGEAYVELITRSDVSKPYLVQLSGQLDDMQAAAGDSARTAAALTDIYGFSVDLAFRCNITSDLLLQTTPEFRVNGTDEFLETQGAGSYMRFTSEQLSEDQMTRMMDAVRIGFLDNQNTLLGVAKLGVASYTVTEDGVEAPLYLYDYVISDGCISVGGRLEEDRAITQLTKGVPTVISVVVWLDGDYVDNGLAAISGRSMDGVLNLQFASGANLLSADFDYEEPKEESTD